MILTVNYALKKAIVEASFVLKKAPNKVNSVDSVESNSERKRLKTQVINNHLPFTEITR